MGYTKDVYDRAWRGLEKRRQQAQEQMQERRREVRGRIPQLEQVEKEMAATAAVVAKTVLANPGQAGKLVEELGKKNLGLQKQRAQLLEEQGYPADYLQEQFSCAQCRDSGYVGTKMCGCLRELLRREAAVQLDQVSKAKESTFADFLLEYYPAQPLEGSGIVPRSRMAEVLEFCQQYAQQFHRRAPSLLMLGHTGLGKTHLSLAIARTVTEKGYGVVYTPVQKLMDRLEAEKFSRDAGSSYAQTLRSILECDLLILDDLGTEFATSFTNSALYNILNSRLVEGIPTIVNTNLDVSAIEERYTQRMASRLTCEYTTLRFHGKDVRYIKKMQSMR